MTETAAPADRSTAGTEADPLELGADGLPLLPRRREAPVVLPEKPGRLPIFSGTRGRLVASYLVLLVLAGAITTLALRQLLTVQLEDRVNDALQQEIYEISELEYGTDPQTAQPFESLERVYETFLRRNEPSQDEALVAFLQGELYDANLTRFPVNSIPAEALERWAEFSRRGNPGEQLTGKFSTAKGTAHFRAVRLDRGGQVGAFVVTILPVAERSEIRELQFYSAVIAVAVVLLAAGAAWLLSGRVLAPMSELTETARSISESDLTRRITVRGSDEAANMARTFNAMLDRLEAVYRSQLEFLRAAGHELRTPLTVATGHLEVLGGDEHERDATIRLVVDELNRMARVVDDLHSLAEAEHPDFLTLRPIDIRTFANDLLAKASALGDREWRLDAITSGTLIGDRDRLAQAVLNLCDNAVKNTQRGDTIAVGCVQRGDDLHLWVRDTGVGVANHEQARIFDRFIRGAGAGQRYRGAGLGLAIVKSVAEAHGGRVEVASEQGEGSQFTIVLPWAGQ